MKRVKGTRGESLSGSRSLKQSRKTRALKEVTGTMGSRKESGKRKGAPAGEKSDKAKVTKE